jgi:hypothetical protein
MILRTMLLLLFLAARVGAAEPTIKEANTAPPTQLDKSVRALLESRSVQFLNESGESVAEFWFPKTVAAEATADQVKNGLTYREVPQSTLLGAVRLDREFTDYRKQKTAAGVYTLRLAYQPDIGEHENTAPHTEFALLSPAADDCSPELIKDVDDLREMSRKSTDSGHPAVLLLFPVKDPGKAPKFETKPANHGVLHYRQDVTAAGTKTVLPIGLNLLGSSKVR